MKKKRKRREKKINNVRDSLAINNRLLASCSFPFVPPLSFSIYIYLYATSIPYYSPQTSAAKL